MGKTEELITEIVEDGAGKGLSQEELAAANAATDEVLAGFGLTRDEVLRFIRDGAQRVTS